MSWSKSSTAKHNVYNELIDGVVNDMLPEFPGGFGTSFSVSKMEDRDSFENRNQELIEITRELLFQRFHALRQQEPLLQIHEVAQHANMQRVEIATLFLRRKQSYQLQKERIVDVDTKKTNTQWSGIIPVDFADEPGLLSRFVKWLRLKPANNKIEGLKKIRDELRTRIISDYQILLILNTIPGIIDGTITTQHQDKQKPKDIPDYGTEYGFGLDYDDGYPN